MTTKPLVGSQAQRQSQRSLNSNITSRPSPQRSLSSSSPTRRYNEALIDLTLDVPDSTSARYGQTSRTGGSRLKQEISNESGSSSQTEKSGSGPSNIRSSRQTLPPRGRPQLHSDVRHTRAPRSSLTSDQNYNQVFARPFPLPVRPGRHAPPFVEKPSSSIGISGKKDARPKPFVLEIPPAAPSYSPNGHADFFPWNGNHAEDQFTEAVIRGGFFDKSQMSQNETGSAKASIYPSLKHKSGLQTLSSLFSSVLAQRRAHGNITANSTFKPPPRVTVTDTKREIWLKDLANPTISLRRLSRSIPHGIRGKVLLEHSLNKNIPIERAVWLAKCVGANELRSFKRKGAGGAFAMGGEAKWVRDFTVCVEQVLESIIGSCGEKDFRRRIYYAIRLAAHFHAECLIDREHYIDWILSSLEATSQAKLPILLLIAQVYWEDILRYRRFGRRFTTTLLNRFSEAIQHPDSDILGPLNDRLRLLLNKLMISNPDNFVCPEIWFKHRQILQAHLSNSDERLTTAWDEINRRNIRLTTVAPEAQHPPRQRLINILDKSLFTLFTPEVIHICWQLDDDKTALIHAVLDWSTSCYRPGHAKVFIGARIIRSWRRLGADITASMLSFLDSSACEIGRNRSSFYHLVSELARSNDFCISTYLQWLISRGGIHDHSDLAPDGPCGTRLLAELPIHDLSGEMVGLRRTLLCRADYPVDIDDHKIAVSISIISNVLKRIQVASKRRSLQVENNVKSLDDLRSLNRASKSHIGSWLRHEVEAQMLPSSTVSNKWNSTSPATRDTSVLMAATFGIVRDYLEIIDDFSMLADVIKIATASRDPQTIASCADTINMHAEIFAAIGAIKGLFDLLLNRSRSFADDRDIMPRVILASLIGLSSRIPDNQSLTAQLTRQLALSGRKCAAVVCSPISDHMAGGSQNNDAEFVDEVEKVLASGTSIDRGTMERLFQRVVHHLSISWDKSPEQQRKCVLLLTTLRDFNPQPFDLLMASWISYLQNVKHRPSLVKICGPLVGLGCLSLKDLVNACLINERPEDSATQKVGKIIATELLALIAAPITIPEILTSEEAYRVRLVQSRMQIDNPELTLTVIRSAIEMCSTAVHDIPSNALHALNVLGGPAMHEILQTLVLIGGDMAGKILVHSASPGSTDEDASKLMVTAINKLLVPTHQSETSNFSVCDALKCANYLNLPFCQLKMASTFCSGKSSQSTPRNMVSPQLDDLNRAVESAIMTGGTTWACIIPSLDIATIQYLRRGAENQLLALFHAAKASGYNDMLRQGHQLTKAENLLVILDLTIDEMYTEKANAPYNPHSCFPDIINLLSGASQYIASTQQNGCKIAFFTKWLPLLLSFTASQTVALEHSKAGNEQRGRAILILIAILLDLYVLKAHTDIEDLPLEQCFDLVLSMVDVLPDDIRLQCGRNSREASSNPIISYIYSIMATPSDWLHIYQRGFLKTATAGRNGSNTNTDHAKESSRQSFPFTMKRWEMLGEPTPNMGENDTSLSLTLFASRKGVN
ncbi:23e34830-c2a0-4824-b86a-9131de662131 [Sclerotinia trifoliorum]|uniref:Mediator of RNA polymerase II transcription subunit 12 n=1 Tax=Sclerotinia trifoliorum TaxID=28548 RepID=A0A8H2ZTE6_9HELO|nr:23e34830-c2a0-4824-b86a-9131de662131 [Sclerotinia trifoliorum]